ncbi:peptidase inhibitor family I36 protein [Stackebrandtia albiflava]|uniref:peptidase inhibitor family I36 protein n=1 Tax=Stackebrandtia albiflava TaxID=406432 RepID=UPI001315410F|nr:peptidase inhibitor family I36 protein [Stackebrandtia albiflava]
MSAHRIRIAAVTAAAGMAILAGAEAAAATETTTATEAAESCPQGWFCGYDEVGYQGEWFGGAETDVCYTPMNGVRSVANRMGREIRFYSEPNCLGEFFDVPHEHGVTGTAFPVASVSTARY